MKRHPLVERLWPEIEAAVSGLGFELVQMTFGGLPGGAALTVYVDRPAGVSAEDCAYAAEHLSVLLDALDPVEGSYSLIVSSPGLDRPLGRDEDFARFAGRSVLVRYHAEAGKAKRLRGRLLGVEGDAVRLETEAGEQAVPLAQITAANLQYDWEGEGAE